jgi:bifunctional enzyme CysN/CysC
LSNNFREAAMAQCVGFLREARNAKRLACCFFVPLPFEFGILPRMDIREYLDQDQKKDLLRLLTAGSVDDGKSTLIGRLLFDSKKLYEDQLSALERDSKREGHAGDDIDYALLLDGLKAEREQGITIDVAYRYFSTAKRKFIIADTPGHEQYTRNMITGGSTANLAILLVDARKGVITQTKRHSFLVSLLGIKHVVVAINKMDLVDFSQEVFDNICDDYRKFVAQLDIPDITFIPLSALKGDNVVDLSPNTPWYHGNSLLGFLETVHVTSDRNFSDLRYPVQYVIRPNLDYRGYAAKVASGIIREGDEVMVLPSKKTSKVTSILLPEAESAKHKMASAKASARSTKPEAVYGFPPQSVSITLADELDISRGDMLVHPDNLPRVSRSFEAMLVWMDEDPMDPYTQYYIKQTTNNTKTRIEEIKYKVDINTLEKQPAAPFTLNEIGKVAITTVKPLFFDPYKKNRNTGSFVLIDPITHNTVAVGMIQDTQGEGSTKYEITREAQPASASASAHSSTREATRILEGKSLVTPEQRQRQLNQVGATLWITGLHGIGKNELAYRLEKELFDRGAITVLLDGKTVRAGLSRELDYSPADRAENLRRVAHICRMLNDQGLITICSFISPDAGIRDQVAEIIGEDRFLLVYLKASLEFARNNDKYHLYALADEGKIDHLAGVDAEYQEPKNPTLTIDAENDPNPKEIIKVLINNKII